MTRKEKTEQRPRLVSAEERVKSWRTISRRRRIIVRRVEETVALRFADLSSQRADATCQHRRKIKVAASALTFSFLCVDVSRNALADALLNTASESLGVAQLPHAPEFLILIGSVDR